MINETRFIKDWAEIGITGLRAGENARVCPNCVDSRKPENRRKKPLNVNYDKGIAKCHNCEITYVISKIQEKEWKRPEWKNNTKLPTEVIQWFEGRGISQEVITRMKISYGKQWMPQTEKEHGVIEFNYFRNDVLVNIKYRTREKHFKLVADAEKIFYNLNGIKDTKECIIVEGEIDALSFIQATRTNVVSVPNGANKKNNNLDYLENCYQYFDDKEKIYIAVDNDEPGHGLAKDLILRFGAERCYIIDFKDCKDANEYLIKYGATELFILPDKAKQVPLSDVITVNDISQDIDDYYNNGIPSGLKIEIPEIDCKINWESARLTVVTGIPTHGKSEVVDFIAERLAVLHGLKFAMYSPENFPIKYHFGKISEKIIGKRFYGEHRMNESELKEVKHFINNHFYWITPDYNFSLDNIIAKTKELYFRYGVNALVIDPWNKVQKDMNGVNETQAVQEMLNELTAFKQRYNMHIFVVAHPKKMMREKGKMTYEVPTLYDISGSSEFYNQADYGMCVYRDWNEQVVYLHIQKIKFRHLGEEGVVPLKYNVNNGRYSFYNYGNPIYDNYNHLVHPKGYVEKYTQAVLPMKPPPANFYEAKEQEPINDLYPEEPPF